MKVRDVMTAYPLLATAREADHDRVRALMEDAEVHHVPVIEGDLVVGVWARGPDDSVLLLGPDRVAEVPADAEADEAMAMLMRDAEVVLVRDRGLPAGILTRSDALAILRAALGRGVGRRYRRPTVIRVAGSRGSGKTTLIMRTLAALGDVDAVVLQANQATDPEAARGAREVVDPSAHWRAGLGRAVARISEARLILVEDRDEQPDLAHGIGEDVQVAVVTADEIDALPIDRLSDAQAIVVTHVDSSGLHDVPGIRALCEQRWPGLAVFAVATTAGDPGMEEWVRWVRRQVERRHG
jgi:hydrogenase nickel incorporation protein HypB